MLDEAIQARVLSMYDHGNKIKYENHPDPNYI